MKRIKVQNGKIVLPDPRNLIQPVQDRIVSGLNNLPMLTLDQLKNQEFDRIARRQGSLKEVSKKDFEKKAPIIDILSNPMTALAYKIRGQDMPSNFTMGDRNVLDIAVDVVNPMSYARSAKNIGRKIVNPIETLNNLVDNPVSEGLNIGGDLLMLTGMNSIASKQLKGLFSNIGTKKDFSDLIKSIKNKGIYGTKLTPLEENLLHDVRVIGSISKSGDLSSSVKLLEQLKSKSNKIDDIYFENLLGFKKSEIDSRLKTLREQSKINKANPNKEPSGQTIRLYQVPDHSGSINLISNRPNRSHINNQLSAPQESLLSRLSNLINRTEQPASLPVTNSLIPNISKESYNNPARNILSAYKTVKNSLKGSNLIPAHSLSSDSYNRLSLPLIEKALKEGIVDVNYHGYNIMNRMGFPTKAKVDNNLIVKEANSYINNINRLTGKNFPFVKKEGNSILYPNFTITRKQKGGISNTGYLPDSPDRFNSFNIIPSNNITMKKVKQPIVAYPNVGQSVVMQPEQDYYFPGADYVTEVPIRQFGGDIFTENPFIYQNGGLVRGGTKAVQNHQRWMNEQFGAGLKEDGAWGPKTQAAYVKFVNPQGLPVTDETLASPKKSKKRTQTNDNIVSDNDENTANVDDTPVEQIDDAFSRSLFGNPFFMGSYIANQYNSNSVPRNQFSLTPEEQRMEAMKVVGAFAKQLPPKSSEKPKSKKTKIQKNKSTSARPKLTPQDVFGTEHPFWDKFKPAPIYTGSPMSNLYNNIKLSYKTGGQFKVGQHVGWNSEAGHVSGTIKKIHTKPFKVNGYTRHASKSDPQYEIKSSKTDHIAYHFGSALHKMEDGGIHIKKSHEGLFTKQANAAGMGVQEFARRVLSAPEGTYSPTTRKRANFARNFGGKKQIGGESIQNARKVNVVPKGYIPVEGMNNYYHNPVQVLNELPTAISGSTKGKDDYENKMISLMQQGYSPEELVSKGYVSKNWAAKNSHYYNNQSDDFVYIEPQNTASSVPSWYKPMDQNIFIHTPNGSNRAVGEMLWSETEDGKHVNRMGSPSSTGFVYYKDGTADPDFTKGYTNIPQEFANRLFQGTNFLKGDTTGLHKYHVEAPVVSKKKKGGPLKKAQDGTEEIPGYQTGIPIEDYNPFFNPQMVNPGNIKNAPRLKPNNPYNPSPSGNILNADLTADMLSLLGDITDDKRNNTAQERLLNSSDVKYPTIPSTFGRKGYSPDPNGIYDPNGYFINGQFVNRVPYQYGLPVAQYGGVPEDLSERGALLSQVSSLPDNTSLAPKPLQYSYSPGSNQVSDFESSDATGTAFNFLRESGFPDHIAAGIVGNLSWESGGFNNNVISGKVRGDNHKATGIAQWHPDRWNRVSRFVESQGLDPYSLQGQLTGLVWELNTHETKALQKVLKANNSEEAAQLFDKWFERSNQKSTKERAKIASDIYNTYSSDNNIAQNEFQEGGEYELNDSDILEILRNGGQVEFI